MKLKVAVAGYGNLGKSLLHCILQDNSLQLVTVFSRRNEWQRALPFEAAKHLKGKIDIVLLALGSFDDIAKNVAWFADFNTVDSFDTHNKISQYKQLLNDIKGKTLSVCATGWDPGVLSICRAALSLDKSKTATFWGEGISQGHSNALRSISGVIDAVEVTCPNTDARQAFLRGENVDGKLHHTRLCYINCATQDQNRIANTVVNMPDYFEGQNVKIVFCSQQKVDEIKKQTRHSGQVLSVGADVRGSADVQLACNTDYTAKIMLRYAKAVPQLQKDGFVGALDPFDIPLKYVIDTNLL